jgi:transposase
MDLVELIYSAAALSGQPPTKAVQAELNVPYRTAADWISKARTTGRLEGMSYIAGRQADG